MELEGKVALVTGAAHRVGRGIALALASEGIHIILHYRTSVEDARQTASEISRMGTDVLPVQADLSEPAQIAMLFDAAKDHFGRLDILVNSAASFERSTFHKITFRDWDRVMAINLRAPFLCSQHAVRLMDSYPRSFEESALIVNIADGSGTRPWSGYIHHGVSKAGLIHLTRVAALELSPTIRVNAIIPGPILPPAGMEPEGEAWKHMNARIPLRHSGDPDDIGQAVVFLAANDYITGAVLPVDGGEGLLGTQARVFGGN
jgi:NAD(P)-dependent dehydrogenase (short-subunit alcohol dehydrogenase family)